MKWTYSVTFVCTALVTLPVCVILYGRCALGREGILHPPHLERSQIRIRRGHLFSRLSGAGVSPAAGRGGGCLMRPAVERIQWLPSLQVRAVSLRKGPLPCRVLTDGWAGQSDHSEPVLRLPKASDLPDHCSLVTSSSWSRPERVSVFPPEVEWKHRSTDECQTLTFGGIVKYSFSRFLFDRRGCAVFPAAWVAPARPVKPKWGRPVFFCQQLLLSFAAHSTDIQCRRLNSTGGATCRIDRVINNGTEQRPTAHIAQGQPTTQEWWEEPKDTHLMVHHNQCYCHISPSSRSATTHTHTLPSPRQDQTLKLPRRVGLTSPSCRRYFSYQRRRKKIVITRLAKSTLVSVQ